MNIYTNGGGYLSITIIVIFSVLIIGMAVAAFINKKIDPDSMATKVTTMGVIGTFLGITIGLLHFDTSNIDASIPHLLNSLKLAFVTSLFGQIASLLLSFIKNTENIDTAEDQAECKLSDNKDEAILHILKDISIGIGGAGDTSLVSNIQKLRISTTDGFSELNKTFGDLQNSFNEFSSTMKEQSVDAIIAALESVIKDFNKNLTEQFGSNFEKLNESVGKMIEWQDKYKQHLEDNEICFEKAKVSFENIVNELKKSSNSLSDLASSSTVFTKSVSNLETCLGYSKDSIEMLKAAVDSLLDDIPSTKEEMHNLVALGKGNIDSTNAILEAVSRSTNQAKETITEIGKGLLEYTGSTNKELAQCVSTFNESIVSSFTKMENGFESMGKNVDTHTTEAIGKVKSSVDVINTTLESGVADINTGFKNIVSDLSVNVKEVSSNILNSSNSIVEAVASAKGELVSSANVFNKSANDTVLEMSKSFIELGKGLDSQIQTTLSKIHGGTDKINADIESTMNTLATDIKTAIAHISRELKNNIVGLDNELGEVLGKALNALANNLTSLSNHFVNDYRPLTERLREVVRLAERLEHEM